MTAESTIPATTRIGAVTLTVAGLDGMREFYERAIGLAALDGAGEGRVALGAGGEPLVELVAEPDAPARPPRTTGLFHLAILVGDRRQLALALRRAVAAGAGLSGASDHLVSEALYLHDPEGNGIELYRDRPRAEWLQAGGELAMATLPLDLEALLGEAAEASERMAPDTRIGHVHLNVGDLGAAERFYADGLGLDVTVRGYPGALFLSAGGYHHHVGLNTWAGEGAPSPPPGSRGLRHYALVLPQPEDVQAAADRLAAAGHALDRRDGAVQVADPSGNALLLRAAF